MSLKHRLIKLEEQSPPASPAMFAHWGWSKDPQRLRCDGLEFIRQEGEELQTFMSRAMGEVSATRPHKHFYWLETA